MTYTTFLIFIFTPGTHYCRYNTQLLGRERVRVGLLSSGMHAVAVAGRPWMWPWEGVVGGATLNVRAH